MNAKALSVIMGHATIAMTFDVYGKLMPGGLDEAAAAAKTQKTPRATIELAKRRLADWRRRGDQERVARGKPPLH